MSSIHFRDFDAEVSEQAQSKIGFKLSGEQFECVSPVPVGALIVVARDMTGDAAHQMAGTMTLLEAWTHEADHERLRKAVSKVTDPNILQKVIEYLVESSTNRPTSEP